MCRFTVQQRIVLPADRAARQHSRSFFGLDGADAGAWRADQDALHRHRHPVFLQGGNQGLPDTELGDHLGHVELRVRRESLGRRAHGFLITRREGAQRVLDPVPELAKNLTRHIVRELRAEVDAYALGADEPHDLFDAIAAGREAHR